MISVIIPAFNCENKIEKCINLLKKNNTKFEIIVIEDCSNDNTLNILEKISGITIIKNSVNIGAGASRNKGIEHANGDFICFVDADDEVSERYLDNLYTVIGDNDIAICDLVTKGKEVKKYSFSFSNKIDLIKNPMIASPCAKLFKKKLFEKNSFPEGIINEDLALIVPLVINTDKIVYCSDATYFYINNYNSVQNQKFSIKKFDVFKAYDICISNINSDIYEDYLITTQIIFMLIYMLINEESFIDRLKYLRLFRKNVSRRGIKLERNKYFFEYIMDKGKLYRYYYLVMFYLLKYNFVLLANLEIELFHYLKQRKNGSSVIKKDISMEDIINGAKYQKDLKESNIKVSVIIPNYNYSQFIYERIYSVLFQKVKIHEIIILDDCSIDDSQEIINKIHQNINEYVTIKVINNEINSGCAFHQWKKGVEWATGDYVWIAEADDYCSNEFLENMVMIIEKNKDIKIAYCNTAYINASGNIIFNKVAALVDTLKTNHWKKDYINDCQDEYNNYVYLNCTIANVSSVIFKKDDYRIILNKSLNYNQVGDWIFYIGLLHCGGNIGYCHNVHNYYRVHGENQTSRTRVEEHFSQIKQLYQWQIDNYCLSDNQKYKISQRLNDLKNEWGLKR